jgi:hypothetical protein
MKKLWLQYLHAGITTVFLSLTTQIHAAELLVVEEAFCPYCAAFNREVAHIYPKTIEGKRAPIRRIDTADPWPEDLTYIEPESRTPTFILIDNGQEIDRLYGYAGDDFFWFLLAEMFAKLEPKANGVKSRSKGTK